MCTKGHDFGSDTLCRHSGTWWFLRTILHEFSLLRLVNAKYGEIWNTLQKVFNEVNRFFLVFVVKQVAQKCGKFANNVIWGISFWKFVSCMSCLVFAYKLHQFDSIFHEICMFCLHFCYENLISQRKNSFDISSN